MHWQGWQLGKPQYPGKHRSHCRAYTPWKQGHWPVTGSQKALTEPCRWQSHAGETRNRGTTLRNPLHASSPLMQAPAACPRLPGWTSRGKHCLRSRANPSRICRIIRRSTLQARLTYVCIHWGQSRRFQGHIGRRFFQPRSAGTGTGLRWGHRRSLASPEGRTHTLQGKKRSRPGTQQRLRPERRAACLSPPALARPVPSLGLSLVGPSSSTPWAYSEFPWKPIASL